MNYLTSRTPFKFLSMFFQMASRASQIAVQAKKNRSDSNLRTRKSVDKLNSTKKLSLSLSELKTIEKKESGLNSGASSPHLSRASSEHSFRAALDRKKSFLDLNLQQKEKDKQLNKELSSKLKKLQKSLSSASGNSSKEALSSEEERPRLKRAYPWQNFNLNSIEYQEDLEPHKKPALRNHSTHSLMSCSDASTSSQSSLRSSISRKSSNDSLEEIKNQMPLFKSILKKSTKRTPSKEVTFNNISTIYKPNSSFGSVVGQPKTHLSTSTSHKKKQEHPSFNERHVPLKEEHSFVYLFGGKNCKK